MILRFSVNKHGIYDGNLDIGAHMKSGIGSLICSRHMFRYTAVTKFILRIEEDQII